MMPAMLAGECTLPMDVGLPQHIMDLPDTIQNLYTLWVRDALEVAYDQVRCHAGQAVRRQKRLYDKRAVKRVIVMGDWAMRYYPSAKKCNGGYSLPGLKENSEISWFSVLAAIRTDCTAY